MTTDEISGKPRVPVGELREFLEYLQDRVEENKRKADGDEDLMHFGVAVGRQWSADELEALIERYDYE